MEAIKRLFTPEFRNRLDAVIQFNALDEKTIKNVVDKFILELESQLEEKGVSIEINEEARDWLAVHGYDKAMGARPMARVIKEQIKKPLAEELLFGKLEHGGHVVVTVRDGELHFDLEPKVAPTAEVEAI
jgi:ATP-dependent Clp protease ATP-binding subunit ClpA